MAYKSSFVIPLFLSIALSLAGCASRTTSPPTADQDIVAIKVAATVQAAFSATQHAFSETQSYTTLTPTPQPTQTEASLTSATPTNLPLPDDTISTDQALRIAYTKDGNVYLWTSGDGSTGLTNSYDAVDLRISTDGEYIAYKRQDLTNPVSQELWVVNTNGIPNPRVLVSSSELLEIVPPDPESYIYGAGVLNFVWKPSTHEVAYSTLILHEGTGFGPNYDLRLVNADTLTKFTLFDTGEGGAFFYSPDGNQISLCKPEGISLVNADGSNLREDVLTFPHVSTHSEYLYTPHPIWASDSNSLRVAIPPEDTLANPLPPTSLWLIPVDGSPSVLLGNVQAMPFVWPDNAFAPNLEHVIYAMSVGDKKDNQRELRISNPDGSNATAYDTGKSLEFVSWSPDAQHFLYRINGGANEGVYLGGINHPPKLIAFDPHSVMKINWLGGMRLVFLLQDGNQWLLLIQNLSNDELRRVDVLPDTSPTFDNLP